MNNRFLPTPKSLISALMSFVMILSLVPVTANMQQVKAEDNGYDVLVLHDGVDDKFFDAKAGEKVPVSFVSGNEYYNVYTIDDYTEYSFVSLGWRNASASTPYFYSDKDKFAEGVKVQIRLKLSAGAGHVFPENLKVRFNGEVSTWKKVSDSYNNEETYMKEITIPSGASADDDPETPDDPSSDTPTADKLTIDPTDTTHTHEWDSATGKCKICGVVCAHENKVLDRYAPTTEGRHKAYYKCSTCGLADISGEEAECTWELQAETGTADYAEGKHTYKCSICAATKKENHVFDKVESITANDAETHTIIKACKCGFKYVSEEDHDFLKDVCSDCGFKRVMPGKISGLTIKKIKKGRMVKAKGYTYYNTKYKVTFKKVKNAKYCELTYCPTLKGEPVTKKIKSGAVITIETTKKGSQKVSFSAVSKTGNKRTIKNKKVKY